MLWAVMAWSHAADEVPNAELCSGDVAAIRFEGNRVTRAQVMARELPQRTGMPCVLDDVIDGLTRLEDLGLFRSVRVELHPLPSSDRARAMQLRVPSRHDGTAIELQELPNVPGQLLEVRYVVREKFFFLGLPRVSRTSDGEVRAGVSLEWSNFLGRLHEMKLTSEWRQEDDGQGRGGFVHSLDYDVPRFLGSDNGVGVRLGIADRQVGFQADAGAERESVGEGQLASFRLGVTLASWLSERDGVQGLRLFYGAALEHRDYTLEQGVAGDTVGGTDLGWRVGLEHRAVHRDRYRRRGTRTGAAFSFANRQLGSDFDWHRVDGWLAWYHPVGSGLDNLNLSLSAGVSENAPFGDRFYAIGGGEILRGVQKGQREGDVRLLLNVEYLRASLLRPALRWVVFADAGNAWPIDAVEVDDVLVRGGIGARYKLEALSRRDLRIDLAWDPQEARVVPYLSTQLTF